VFYPTGRLGRDAASPDIDFALPKKFFAFSEEKT
jgi:hypothetical protein